MSQKICKTKIDLLDFISRVFFAIFEILNQIQKPKLDFSVALFANFFIKFAESEGSNSEA